MPLHRLAIALCLCAATAQADEKRHADAHEHGHGSLDIAIEGNTVAMALRVPGADIVGFEHAPESDEQTAALAAAEAELKRPLALFVMPPAAGCRVTGAEIEFETEHDEDRDKAHADDKDEHAGEHKDHDEQGHAEFHAEYALTCASTAAISHIDFAYFTAFPAAEELEVQVITDRGQTGADVTREAPRLDLAGLT